MRNKVSIKSLNIKTNRTFLKKHDTLENTNNMLRYIYTLLCEFSVFFKERQKMTAYKIQKNNIWRLLLS